MTPDWLLFRLVTRSLDVLERHKDKEPALGIFAQTLGVHGPVFMRLYDRAQVMAAAQPAVTVLRGGAVDKLGRKLRGWVGPLANDLPTFDPSLIGDKPNVPEDMINDAETVFTVLAEHEAAGHPPPFYAQVLKDDLQAAITAARADQRTATGAQAELAELRQQIRGEAERVQADLVAFRRTLRAHIGSGHPDYQRLRVTKNQKLVVEVEEGEAAIPPPPASAFDDADDLDDGLSAVG